MRTDKPKVKFELLVSLLSDFSRLMTPELNLAFPVSLSSFLASSWWFSSSKTALLSFRLISWVKLITAPSSFFLKAPVGYVLLNSAILVSNRTGREQVGDERIIEDDK